MRCEAQGILGYNKESSKRFQRGHFSTICFISILIEQFDRQCQSESVNGRTTCRIYPRKEQKKDEVGSSGLCGSITVQRLSANVEGKCQMYSRIGALTLVPLEEEVTLYQTLKLHAKHILKQIWNAMSCW